MLSSTEHAISTAHRKRSNFLAFKLSEVVFIKLINVTMPLIVVICEHDKFPAHLS